MSFDFALAYELLPKEFLNTCYMVFFSAFFGFLIGLPLGVVLTLTKRGGLKENRGFYKGLALAVNIGRSVPFAILIIAIIPFTRFIVGTSIGTTAAIVPLTIAAIPFIARVVESALSEVDNQLVEAAQVMGSNTIQMVTKVYIPEALPALISGMTLTLVNLVGYSAMAGLVGGGGLGKIAIQYGYQRFNGFLMFLTILLLIFLVECIQMIGNKLTFRLLLLRGKMERSS